MTHRTAPPPDAAEQPPADLPDIETMRETAAILLDGTAVALAPAAELDTLMAQVCGHLEVLAPEIEQGAQTLDERSAGRLTALEWVWEARSRLEAEPSARTGGTVGHARRMARVLNALCDQYEVLGCAL